MLDQWTVSLILADDGTYASTAGVRRRGERAGIEGCGVGIDPALTIWSAMCRLEQAIIAIRPRLGRLRMFA
jgi:hypothetical protein